MRCTNDSTDQAETLERLSRPPTPFVELTITKSDVDETCLCWYKLGPQRQVSDEKTGPHPGFSADSRSLPAPVDEMLTKDRQGTCEKLLQWPVSAPHWTDSTLENQSRCTWAPAGSF